MKPSQQINLTNVQLASNEDIPDFLKAFELATDINIRLTEISDIRIKYERRFTGQSLGQFVDWQFDCLYNNTFQLTIVAHSKAHAPKYLLGVDEVRVGNVLTGKMVVAQLVNGKINKNTDLFDTKMSTPRASRPARKPTPSRPPTPEPDIKHQLLMKDDTIICACFGLCDVDYCSIIADALTTHQDGPLLAGMMEILQRKKQHAERIFYVPVFPKLKLPFALTMFTPEETGEPGYLFRVMFDAETYVWLTDSVITMRPVVAEAMTVIQNYPEVKTWADILVRAKHAISTSGYLEMTCVNRHHRRSDSARLLEIVRRIVTDTDADQFIVRNAFLEKSERRCEACKESFDPSRIPRDAIPEL